ncbi:zinc transporter ZupT [Sulfurimonas sp. CVO]|jgi:ZIP family zinc transporter|uniref:Zinc transporter ZupT n=1 Tax=Sulfurimonas xiamenensis TaxID=2590021 RepID=A0AAJ4A3R2_9BACT|nr:MULTISPECIES: zinc transporter ZupT [Sulfurimonas]QFR43361.1 zinc transporter ZupT [Sulfurimonas xiamenensis]QHG91078.1 zinc transporter ZupT [Sulfurimonas sp. CVO]
MQDLSLETFLFAFALTLFAGLSTSIGAVLAFFSKSKNYTILSIGMGFSAGVMIYVSFMEILNKSKDSFTELYSSEITGESLTLLCFFAGIALSAFIDKMIPEDVNPHETRSNSELLELKPEAENFVLRNSKLKRTGIFTALAIGIHNFPEGFATFVSALESPSIGITIAFAIAIHNIPEGMAVSLPIYHATGNKKSAFWYATLSGLAEPIGALVGFFLLFPFMGEATLGITFAMVAGIMIYISFDELLPAARVYGNAHTTIGGITLGMLVMAISLIGFKLV